LEGSTDPSDLLSFAIGDWRGKGKQGGVECDSVMTCLRSPDGSGVEIIQFDDDHAAGKVFYAEHLYIVPGGRAGELKVTRRGFAYQDAGDKLFVMHELARKEGDGVRISPDEERKGFLQNNLKLSGEGEDGLQSVGTTKAGGDSWSFEYHFKRRTKLKH
jgi:hypothetical protein